jgi:hypothetical protein
MSRAVIAGLAAVALAAGCSEPVPICGGHACENARSVKAAFQGSIDRQVDVLFVIDDTPAMAAYAGALSSGLAEIASGIEALVPTTSLHAGFVPASACGRSVHEFIRSDRCGHDASFAGTLAAEFARLGAFGFEGCAPAQPFAALERALATPTSGWEGFLRPDAYLAIIVISASDDASGPPGLPSAVSATVEFVRGLKPDPGGQIQLTAIGPADCSQNPTPDALARRLVQFVQSAGGNGLYYPICDPHYGSALNNLRPLPIDVGPLCVGGVRDTDPTLSGIQADCAVTQIALKADASIETSLLSGCDVSGPPCWAFTDRTGLCGPGRAELEIRREDAYCPDRNTRIIIDCVGCFDPMDPACAGN